MLSKLNLKSEKSIFFILFFFIWIYLWLRAFYVPLLHDEVATFQRYIHTGRYIPPDFHWYANNHILNSALSRISYVLFGPSELALRLPNLLFTPLFFFFWYKISRELWNKIVRWIFMLLPCCSLYFIEFFALSRGYGISMALMAGAVFYLMQVFKINQLKYYLLCLIFIILGVAANLTLINSAVIIISILFSTILYNFQTTTWRNLLKKVAGIFILGIFPLTLFAWLALELKKRGLLDVGTSEGFLRVTVKSLTNAITESTSPVTAYYVAFIFSISSLVFVYSFIQKPTLHFFYKSNFTFFYLLAGNIIITLLLGKFFQTNYPEDRAGLYFFPLLIGSLCFMIDSVANKFNPKIIVLIFIPLLFLPIHFLYNLNLNYSSFWKNDRIPYRFYNEIKKEYLPGTTAPTVGARGYHMLCWYYINFRNGGQLGVMNTPDYPRLIEDFQIRKLNENPTLPQYYDSIDYDKYSELYLWKRKHFIQKSLLSTTEITTGGKTTNEFFEFINGPVDSLAGKTLFFSYDLSIFSKQKPFEAWVVVTVFDKEENTLRYEFISLDWLKTERNGESHNFINAMLVYNLPKESHRLVTYLWNQRKVPFSIKDGKCFLYEIKTDLN